MKNYGGPRSGSERPVAPWGRAGHRSILPLMDAQPRRGHTLVETTAALLLFGTLLGAAVPRFRVVLDRMAVREVRERTVALYARARAEAVSAGGAVVVASEERQIVELWADGSLAGSVETRTDHRVELEVAGRSLESVSRYDALGLGRMASRTLRFHRGEAVASVVISSYGRVLRR